MPTTTNILLVEDNPVSRLEIQSFLEKNPSLKVIAEAVNGEEAILKVQRFEPDITLMDVSMPVMDGIQAVERIRSTTPGAKIIMLTGSDSERDIFASLSAGVQGYCLKDTDDDRIIRAIAAVLQGDLWLDPAIARKVVNGLPRTPAQDGGLSKTTVECGRSTANLSAREQEVLALLVRGLSNAEMARTLVISQDTIKTHMRHIMEKLAVTDRTQAAIKALRSGLV